MAAQFDFAVDSGCSYRLQLALSDASNNPLNLTGCAFCFEIYKPFSSGQPLQFAYELKSSAASCDVANLSPAGIECHRETGAVWVTIGAGCITQRMGSVAYRIVMTDSGGIVTKILGGNIENKGM